EAVRLKAPGRVEPLDAQLFQPLAEARHVVFKRAERDVVEFLARAFGDHAPAVWMAVSVERKPAALFLGVEPERAVELLGIGDVRYQQVEMVERMHAELAGAARYRLRHGTNLGHGNLPLLCPVVGSGPGQCAAAKPSRCLLIKRVYFGSVHS